MLLTTECFVARCVTTDEAVAPDCFGFRDVDVPELPPNGLLIKTKFIGLEPYMRIWGIGPQGWGLDNVMDRVPRARRLSRDFDREMMKHRHRRIW